ncbi:glycoside hydrolase family 3 C-terminal domain-containing protein [Paenibacillus sp. HW567]|uniref:glycoside hydrolase family 3 C-terminal domain-containing protein n=1 Tax=Paenibacillus sp. HW567 TaxID=1034769 RepID=UPI0003635A07|nr:glycoside hydrolase family 3 C-terminal domain-containing protein [Paenibacillus sp. HW567]
MVNDIDKLISQMTLHEKVMLCTGDNMWKTKAYEHLGIPSILMSDGSSGVRFQKNSDVSGDISFYESISGSFDSAEAVANTHEATCFPSNSTVSCSWNPELVYEIGQAIARECRRLGIHLLLGPGMNIRRHPLTARNFEYYSEDPCLTGEIAAAMVKGVQDGGVGASPKHFACHNSDTKRTRVNVTVEERALREIYLAGFERVVRKARPATIMSAYNKINGVQTSEDPELLNGILRGEWGFDGVVVSDWGAVKDAAAATRAGLDLQMPLSLSSSAYLENAVRNGELDEELIDLRVKNIVQLIFRLTENYEPLAEVDFTEHHRLARAAAAESIVLLKNEQGVLPLAPGKAKKLAVVGRLAAEPLYQGTGCAIVNAKEVDIPLEHIRKLCPEGMEVRYAPGYHADGSTDAALLEEADLLAREADVVLVFAGAFLPEESDDYNRKDMDIEPGHEQLIAAICAANPNTVLILANGESVMMPWADQAKAVLETWFSGEGMGEALATILFGHVNPSGKLSATIPEKLSDTPAFLSFPGNLTELHYSEGIYVGYRYYDMKGIAPRYPFGHGLSYTQFAYSNLTLSEPEVHLPSVLKLTVDITNTGEVYGKEVVQLYLAQPHSKLPRPPQELKGFAKVALHPGETKSVEFLLEERDFACYNPECGEWSAASGSYTFRVGASSRDIRLTAEVQVSNPAEPVAKFRTDSGFPELLQNETARQIFYQFMIENGLVTPEQVDNKLDELLAGSFWGILSFMDMHSAGVITYEKMNDVIQRINALLEEAAPGRQ